MNEKIETDNLLFSVVIGEDQTSVSATETLLSFGVFQPSSTVTPLFEGNTVGKAIPVMVEGEYYLKHKVGEADKYREVKFSATDIERLAKKQPRDVPFNYDHRRAPGKDGVKGWLRFGENLHYVGKIRTPDGKELTALFATPELTPEAQDLVKTGIYRDVSVEYRQLDDVLTGVALTSYPVMRNLQFSELDQEETVEPVVAERVENNTDSAVVEINTQEETMDVAKLSELTKDEKKAALDTLLGEFGLSTEAIVQMGQDFSKMQDQNKKTEHQLAMSKAELEINELIGTEHFGLTSEVATEAQEVLAWATTNQDLHFGEEGGAPDVGSALKGLLGVIGKQGAQIALLGGESMIKDEDGTQRFGNVEEDVSDLEDGGKFDEARSKSLADLAKSYL